MNASARKSYLRQSDTKTMKREKKMGITRNSDGIVHVNPNRFVNFYVERRPTVYHNGARYHVYEEDMGIWLSKDIVDIKRDMRNLLHKYVPDYWNATFDKAVDILLPLESKTVDMLESSENYINLRSGLLSLDTFEI